MILVVGATGELGGRVLRLLRDRGDKVRGLVRAQTDDSPLTTVGAETARGDLTDPASLRAACEGVDTVVATATAIARRLSGAGGPSIKEVDGIGMANLVDAAEGAGVKRFVYMSYSGVEAGLGFPLERAKLATERRLRDSTMQVTVIRPDAFQEVHLAPAGRFDMGAGKVAVFGSGDKKRRWVAIDDVAALLAAVVADQAPPVIIEFGGPEALSRNEAIAAAERLTGRKFKRQALPRAVARLGMRLLDKPNPALASVFGVGLMMDLAESHVDDIPLRTRGIQPRPATEFLEQQAAAQT